MSRDEEIWFEENSLFGKDDFVKHRYFEINTMRQKDIISMILFNVKICYQHYFHCYFEEVVFF